MCTNSILFAFAFGFLPGQTAVKPEETNQSEARKQAKADLDKFQGTWLRVKMELAGMSVPIEGVSTAIYSGDVLTLTIDGKPYRTGSIVTLDPGRKPKAINTWDAEGEHKDKTLPGIYEIDGDTMKVCFAMPGKDRPTEFTTMKGSGFLYIEYKRQKPTK